MGRFYFHLKSAGVVIPDEEGQDLPSLSVAQREALSSARDLLANAIKAGRSELPESFVIADEEGRVLDTIQLATVLPKSLNK